MAENKEDLTEENEAEETEIVNPEIDSKYRLILIAAQRSKQLQRGANTRIDADPRMIKPTRIAMEEIKQNKVRFVLTKEKMSQ
ncbi:MAG: DNA-directed RNA polymerase subunit omega [Pyrinomonadaceae bacterium]